MNNEMTYEELALRIVLADCLRASQGEGPQEIRDPDSRMMAIVKGLLREKSIHASIRPDLIVLYGFTTKGQKVYCVGGDIAPYYAITNFNQIKEEQQ